MCSICGENLHDEKLYRYLGYNAHEVALYNRRHHALVCAAFYAENPDMQKMFVGKLQAFVKEKPEVFKYV